MHKIAMPIDNPRQLTQAVIQIIALLGLYQAELARILGLQCVDIGEMASARKFIDLDSEAARQAGLLIHFYNLLYEKYSGDEARMCHWLRRYDNDLSSSPFYLIVDEHQLEQVIAFMELSK